MRKGRKRGASYPIQDGERTISASRLRRASRATKLDAMRTWFLQHFEDPVESCPYESAEGGYLYIWGGPYVAAEVLGDEFGELVPENLIEVLAAELSENTPYWSAVPDQSDLAEYEFEAITQTSQSQGAFAAAMKRTESLAALKVDAKDKQTFLRLVYVSVIASLEAYLSDAFIHAVSHDAESLRRFVETTPEFKKQKIPLAEAFRATEGMPARVKRILVDTIWHRLDRVSQMYAATLHVKFPSGMKPLFRAVEIRHDIVHRNGRDKAGKARHITKKDIAEIIAHANALVDHIETYLGVRHSSDVPPPTRTGRDAKLHLQHCRPPPL